MRTFRCVAAAVVVILWAGLSAGPALGQTVTSISVVEKAGVTTANYPMTVSLVFKQGDVASNVTAKVGAQNLTTQTDVKVRWPDNSVKHALVSFVIPSVPSGGSVTVDFVSGGTNANTNYLTKAQLLATDFGARMDLTIGGTPYSVSARTLLNGIPTPEYWIQGDVCTEFLIRDFGQNVASQLNVQYYVRYYPGWNGFRVDTVVENCWTQYWGNVTYDFNLLLGNGSPQSVFAKTGFTHNYNARWHKSFWQGNTPPAVEVRYNLPYLISTKLLPYYDAGLTASEGTISSAYAYWQSSPHDIMQHGIITTYFPQTGGREEIGLYPTWTARYLLNMDNRLKEVMLSCGDLSGSIPIHFRESDSSRSFYRHVMSINDRPTIWNNWWDFSGTGAADRLPAPMGSTTTEWTADLPHQASFGCIPYMTTGDFYYLEEMYFWAGFDLGYGNWSYRQGATGLIKSEARGDAWAIRNIADAANLAPDTHTLEKGYFTQKVNNNLSSWTNQFITTGNYPSMHYWVDQDKVQIPDTDMAATCTFYTSPWQSDFVLISLAHLQDIGFGSQNLVDWLGVSLVDRFHNPDYNWYRGAVYHIPTMYTDGTNNYRYPTWAATNAGFAVQPGPTDFPNPDGVGDYRFIARAAMTYVLGLTNGTTTWNWYDSHIHSKPSLLQDPTWGLLPRGYPPSDLIAPSGVTNLAASNPGLSTVYLTWTAPGDDDTVGTATTYDIRYSTYPIGNDTDFAAATPVTGAPAPAVAGTAQNMTVTGLQSFQTYYFAMKAIDDGANAGPLSNMAGATTLSGTPTAQFSVSSGNSSEATSPANVAVTLSMRTANVVMVNYAVTGGTATNGTDYSVPAGKTILAALKRDAGLVAGGVLASQFTPLTGSNVILSTVKDASMGSGGNGRYMNYGTTTTAATYLMLGFDLSAYAGATVNKAQLRVRTTQGNSAMQWAAVKSRDWAEGNKNGDYPGNSPSAAGVCWAHPAGLFTGASGYLGWGPGTNAMFDATSNGGDLYTLTDFTSMPGGAAFCVADLTTIVQDWASGNKPNYGLYISVGNHVSYLSEAGTDNEPVLYLDCTVPAGKLQFQPGETSKTFPITVVNDALPEGNETVQLTLSGPLNATLGSPSVYTHTINDDDSVLPSVQFSAASSSGNESVTSVNIPVTLSASSSSTVTVNYAVTGGTASGGGVDYTLASGQLTFNPGVVSQNVPVGVVNDTMDENDETIAITLSSPANANLGANTTHTYTILDDDASPTVQFSAASSNGSEATTSVNLPVSLSAASGKTVTVNYTVTGGTASNPADYTISGTSLTFNPGVTSQNIAITVVNDTAAESNETIIVGLNSPTNATLGTNTSHTYTINDNDSAPPVVQFQVTSSNGSEATTPANLVVTLDHSYTSTVTVDFKVTGGTATPGADYSVTGATNTVVALKRTAGLTQGGAIDSRFSSLNDANVVLATIKDAQMYSGGNNRYTNYGVTSLAPTYMIMGFDLSAYPYAAINKAQLRLRTTQGNNPMQWAAVKSHDWVEGNKNGDYPGNNPSAAGVCWAHPAGLYTGPSGALGWGSGSNAMFDATSNGSDLYALTTFTSMPGGAAWCVADITSAVQDWVAGAKANYGLFASLDNHPAYLSEAGTADQPVLFLDSTLQKGTLTFAPGDTSKNVSLTIVNDTAVESGETIQVTLSNPTNSSLGTNTAHTYTINDND